jgi:hypothetical protein
VDDESIVVEDLRARFIQGPIEVRRRAMDRGGRHYLVNLVIDELLLEREAERRRIHPAFGVMHTAHRQWMDRFLRAEFEPTISPEGIPMEDVRAEYERLRPGLGDPEIRRIEVVAAPTRERATEILGDVRRALATGDEVLISRALHPADEDCRGGQSGELDRTSAEASLGAEAATAAFSIPNINSVYPEPVRYMGRWGVVAIRMVIPPSPPPPFEQVEPQLRQRVYEERRDQMLDRFVDSFREHHRVFIDRTAIDVVPWSPPEPAVETPDAAADVPDGGTS